MYVSIWRYVWKIEKFLLTVADIREKKENFFIKPDSPISDHVTHDDFINKFAIE